MRVVLSVIFLCLGFASALWGDVSKRDLLSTAKLTAYFHDGSYVKSFAAWVGEGYLLSASFGVSKNSDQAFVDRIVVSVVDTLDTPLICFGQAHIVGLDTRAGLALLKMESFSDPYCNARPESSFHKNILKRQGIKIDREFWSDSLSFVYPIELPWGNVSLTTFDKMLSRDGALAYLREKLKSDSLGLPLWDKRGVFLGIVSSVDAEGKEIMLADQEVILDFLCLLVNQGVVKESANLPFALCTRKEQTVPKSIPHSSKGRELGKFK